MTSDEMMAPYPTNPLLPSPLPSLDKNGFVDSGVLDQVVQSLQSSGRLPKPPALQNTSSIPFDSPDSSDPLNTYTKKESQLQDAIKAEYCYYEMTYFSALDAFLQSLASSSLNQQPGQNVQGNLVLAQQTNQRLTVFTQLVNAIAKRRYSESQNMQSQINNLNDGFQKRGVALAEQAKILNKESASADVHKRMVTYTIEKNKANNNLLTLYSLLNISAIAMLIYISRS
jgi:hypothetical protein